MKRFSDIFDSINIDMIKEAVVRASDRHGWKTEVIRFNENLDANCNMIYNNLLDDGYLSFIKYKKLERVNGNGKVRKIDSPTFITRIYQHLFLLLIEPVYYSKDNMTGLNCKPGCGITSNTRRKSVVRLLKGLFYDRLDLEWALIIDQRKCYDHITVKIFRKAMRRIVDDRKLIDFAVNVCFVNGKLPIGTPTSPMVHHIVMLGFDYYAKSISPFVVRYADDVIMAFHTKEDANASKWRVKNYWWYNLGIRAKSNTTRISSLYDSIDFCGYVFHRNGMDISAHNKGYVSVRERTVNRAKICGSDDKWASYFGIFKHADSFNLALRIEKDMKLKDLTSKIKIDRSMDARNIDIKGLIDKKFSVLDYDIRRDNKGNPNWIKCLIGIDEVVDGVLTGKIEAREFHGNYQGIINFVLACEAKYGKSVILPIEDVEIENQCGYIFKDSTNQLKYIGDD